MKQPLRAGEPPLRRGLRGKKRKRERSPADSSPSPANFPTASPAAGLSAGDLARIEDDRRSS